MKIKMVIGLYLIGLIMMFSLSCVSSSTDKSALDTSVAGKWEGLIVPISIPPINFNGAKIFMEFSQPGSFNIIARGDTLLPDIKDTILVLSGTWRFNVPRDSVVLAFSACRALDTMTHELASRDVQGQSIFIPKSIEKGETTIDWIISFADMAPLVPLLGFTIPAQQISLLKALNIDFQKVSQ
jgi:hypothetical protein